MEEYNNTENIPSFQKKRKRLLNFWKLFWNQNDSPLHSKSAQISVEFPPLLLVCSPAVCPQSLAAAQHCSIAAFQELLKTACSSAASRCSRSSKDRSADENKPHTLRRMRHWHSSTRAHISYWRPIVLHTVKKSAGIWSWCDVLAVWMFSV